MDKIDRYNQYELLKDIVRMVYQNTIDIDIFIKTFLKSDIFNKILHYSDVVFYHSKTVFVRFVSKHHIAHTEEQKYDIEIANYIFFIYLAFFHRTGENISSIVKQLPVDDIVNYYEKYHTLSEERVIFISKTRFNKKMNLIRKKRSKDNPTVDLSSSSKNLFIAKQIYSKLFDYPEIRELRYKYIDKREYLDNDTAFLYSEFVSDIDDIVALKDEVLDHIKYHKTNNILFLFASDESLLDKDNMLKIYNNNRKGVPFDKIILFYKNHLLFINDAYQVDEYYIPITRLDISRIEQEYQSRWP